jgi:hypothetical protein
MDPTKIEAVANWPRPKTLCALQAFLGLSGYYCKFIVDYDDVAKPLTTLLKKEAFKWSDEAESAFVQLKQTLMTAPLLQMPDFSKRFMVDCDASPASSTTCLA